MTVWWAGHGVESIPTGTVVQPVPVENVTFVMPDANTFSHVQTAPAATWTFANPLGRLCGVAVFIAGELAMATVNVDPSTITITFASPQSGTAVLT